MSSCIDYKIKGKDCYKEVVRLRQEIRKMEGKRAKKED
jgi:hypothetical protein